jgi:pimeloyl-ACP methyl ester carboxylesterase
MTPAETYQPLMQRRNCAHRIRGIDYAISEWGEPDEPLLIYLHGWADAGSTFQFVVDQLAGSWRVVAPDWRGFGRTDCDCRSYWFPDYLADLHALLEIYSPQQPVRLIGHSMGGNVASLYAGTMPDRVQALINIEGFGLKDSDPQDAPARYREWLLAEVSETEFSRYTDFDALAFRIRKRSPGMSEAAAAFVAREWAAREPDGQVRLRADPRHRLPSPVLYRRAAAKACWRATTAEVLLISGSRRSFASEYSGDPDELYPEAARLTIDDAGHMPHFEAPAALAAAIEDFCRQTL